MGPPDYSTAWDMAQAAVKSFDGSQPLLKHQKLAIDRWNSSTRWSLDSTDPRHLSAHQLREVSKIFSDIFFLQELGTESVLEIRWEALDDEYGVCCEYDNDAWPVQRTKKVILLNENDESLYRDTNFTLCVLMHEMAHAFLKDDLGNTAENFSDPRQEDQTPAGDPGIPDTGSLGVPQSYYPHPDIGWTGHGRAWHHLVKAIEDHMRWLVGLNGGLGREAGMSTELREIGHRECLRLDQTTEDHANPYPDPLVWSLLPYLADMPGLLIRLERRLEYWEGTQNTKILLSTCSSQSPAGLLTRVPQVLAEMPLLMDAEGSSDHVSGVRSFYDLSRYRWFLWHLCETCRNRVSKVPLIIKRAIHQTLKSKTA